ncbi:MAG: hypothetical protein K6B46_05450 [Opitutales bacterium]|nr:hypothetical protein [Opitutales bacterium]
MKKKRLFRRALTTTNARGNATVVEQNALGWTTKTTDPADNVTATAYDLGHGKPSCVTDAQGKTHCYAYDLRGNGNPRADSFGYNSRSELTTATLGNDNFAYAYDNICNRSTATEAGTVQGELRGDSGRYSIQYFSTGWTSTNSDYGIFFGIKFLY